MNLNLKKCLDLICGLQKIGRLGEQSKWKQKETNQKNPKGKTFYRALTVYSTSQWPGKRGRRAVLAKKRELRGKTVTCNMILF